jgi:hypothetical protein
MAKILGIYFLSFISTIIGSDKNGVVYICVFASIY